MAATFAALGLTASLGLSSCGGAPAAAKQETPAQAAALCASRTRRAVVTRITPDAAIDSAWVRYAGTGTGWVSGDSIYAYKVPGLGILDTLSDSFLHSMEVFAHHPKIVHNLFVVQDADHWRTVTGSGGTPAHPAPLVAAPKGMFDLGFGGIVEGRTFQQFYEQERWWGPGTLDYSLVKTFVASFSLPGLRLVSTKEVTRQHPRVRWGSSVSRFGRFTYLYGTGIGIDGVGPAFVARVSGSSILPPWSYWDGHGWSPHADEAAPIAPLVQTQYDVVRFDAMYVLVSSVARPPFTPEARIFFGCSPTGPFTRSQTFTLSTYVGPLGEQHWGGHVGSAQVYVYDALAQPALGPPNRLVLSYDQNDIVFAGIFGDPAIYRPGYLDATIRFGPG